MSKYREFKDKYKNLNSEQSESLFKRFKREYKEDGKISYPPREEEIPVKEYVPAPWEYKEYDDQAGILDDVIGAVSAAQTIEGAEELANTPGNDPWEVNKRLGKFYLQAGLGAIPYVGPVIAGGLAVANLVGRPRSEDAPKTSVRGETRKRDLERRKKK